MLEKELLDNIELSLLGILSDSIYRHEHNLHQCEKAGKLEKFLYSVPDILPIRKQEKYITFALGDMDRLFSSDIDMLLEIPNKSFGIITPTENIMKQYGFTKLKNIPKTHKSFTSFDSVWQIDQFFISKITLQKNYFQHAFGIKNNKVIPLYPYNTKKELVQSGIKKTAMEIEQTFALSASILEDYNLSQFWNVDISDTATLSTYGDESSIKELLDIREAPLTESGRRKKVLHWVTSHKRECKDKTIEIPKHLRGISECNIAGLKIVVTNPSK